MELCICVRVKLLASGKRGLAVLGSIIPHGPYLRTFKVIHNILFPCHRLIMEEVAGIPGKLPPLAPFPAPEIRRSLPPEAWQACLRAWIFGVEFRLRLLPEHFHHFKLSHAASGVFFLSSYFLSSGSCHDQPSNGQRGKSQELTLHRHCLLLFRRLLLETDIPHDYSTRELFDLLANASSTFLTKKLWHDTLQQAWQRQQKQISAAVEDTRSYLIKTMAISGNDCFTPVQQFLSAVIPLAKCLPQAGKTMMTGYDYVDSLAATYHGLVGKSDFSSAEDARDLLTENLFVCLTSLMSSMDPSTSLLLDDLYGLKGNAEAEAKINPNRPTLLSSIVCSTSFVRRLEVFLATSLNSRGDVLLQFLRTHKTKMSYLHPMQQRSISRRRKRKGKASVDHVQDEMHFHRAAQISQIHELFPEAPTPYVLRLLDHFSGDVEAVTIGLLEPGSLPRNLQDPESVAHADIDTEPIIPSDLAPRSTPPLSRSRRNVFDDDDFDKLQISTSQVHFGRKEHDYDKPSDPSEKAKKKAAIMAALASFDSDDDERDDTYDVADVGGAVDNTVDTDARLAGRRTGREDNDGNAQTLFMSWSRHPEMFARDSKTRNSKARQQLKIDTGMSDEQIEGWAVMLSRDHTSLQKLENKYAGPTSFGGQQNILKTSKWSASRSGTATEEDTDAEADDGGGVPRGGGSSRGRSFQGGRGYGRGKGSFSGPASDASTQNARKRKEQGRGRGGANHDRREGRARKMGRGFGSLPPA
jgi:activating signal cointegrator complex subunit 2